MQSENKTSMDTFAAIDLETANQHRSSVCSVGIIIMQNGIVTDRVYSLIRPNPDFYCRWATDIHGISRRDTLNASRFPDVWNEIAPLISGLPLVAHNSPFDEGCLKAVYELYEMEYPGYLFYCTLRRARKVFPELPNHQLHTVATRCGYDLANHHNALADAEACAWIAREISLVP